MKKWKENSMPNHKIRQELESEHHPEVIQARLSGLHRHSYLGDAVLGGIDGGITTFAVAALAYLVGWWQQQTFAVAL